MIKSILKGAERLVKKQQQQKTGCVQDKKDFDEKISTTDVTGSANAHILLTKKVSGRSQGDYNSVGMNVNE